MILVLSAYSADMNLIDAENCNPLHYAAAEGNPNCCKFLAQRGIDIKYLRKEIRKAEK